MNMEHMELYHLLSATAAAIGSTETLRCVQGLLVAPAADRAREMDESSASLLKDGSPSLSLRSRVAHLKFQMLSPWATWNHLGLAVFHDFPDASPHSLTAF